MTRNYEAAKKIDENLEDDDRDPIEYAFELFVGDVGDSPGSAGPVEKTFMALDAIDDLRDRVDELEAENDRLQSTVEQLTDIGAEKSTKEEKVAAIVTWAQRQAGDETADRIVVTARDIIGATGVCRRYAYDLIDDLPEQYDWLLDRSDVSQYGDLEIDKESQTKAVVVDCALLHTDEGAVHKFTTANGAEGVAD